MPVRAGANNARRRDSQFCRSSWMPKLFPPLSLALLLAAPLALSGCGSLGQTEQFAPVCPRLALLKDGADLTRFSPRGHDVTDLVLDGRLVAVPANCEPGRRGQVAASLRVTMNLTRGPAAQGRSMDVPYFVAVMHDGRIIDKQDYVARASFPENVNQITLTSDPVEMSLPADAAHPASVYQIFVSFQLTPEELATNRGRGQR
jgi:hypothetical protein